MNRNEDRILFGLLVLLQLVYFVYLVAGFRIPGGHDGFQYFSMQYYFLNNAAMNGEVAQWMPYMTQGTVANWWYAIQAGFLDNAILPFGSLFKNINFVYLFNAGMFIDEFVLLIGCWLLGKVLLRHSLAVFFFCASIMGSCIWFTQPWHNFHLYYCLPLILYFCHRFLETAQWRYLFGAMNLTLMQSLGNMPYFIPVLTFIVAVYLGAYVLFHREVLTLFRGRVRLSGGAVACLVLNAAVAYMLHAVLTHGTADIVNYNPGRAMNGLTDLNTFLTYGKTYSLLKWKEMILGFSPHVDYGLYGGVLMIPLCVWFLCCAPDKRKLFLLPLIIVLLDFSAAGITAKAAYHAWPLMKYFRGLYLISPVIKLFIVLFAAHALDALIERGKQPANAGDARGRTAVFDLAPLAVAAITVAWHLMLNGDSLSAELAAMLSHAKLYQVEDYERVYQPLVWLRLHDVRTLLLVEAVLWLLWFFLKRQRSTMLVLMLAVQVIDVYTYKLFEARVLSVNIKEHGPALMFEPLRFTTTRVKRNTAAEVPRLAVLKAMPVRVKYWSNDSFLFTERLQRRIRVDHWLLPLDQFMRTYWGQEINDFAVRPKGFVDFSEFHFPSYAPPAAKMAGITEPKIQFFSSVAYLPTENAVSAAMFDLSYKGDIPLVLGEHAGDAPAAARLGEDSRLVLPHTVDAFSANSLRLTVDAGTNEGVWLMYSDVWHRNWKATVDGVQAAVKRADLAYKIIRLHGGVNQVHFYYDGGVVPIIQAILSFCSLAWIFVFFFLGGRALCLKAV